MMISHVDTFTCPAAFALLPGVMDSPSARALVLAIGLQESGFATRVQGGGGPARGFWQFELGGVTGVLDHPASRTLARRVCADLLYEPASAVVYAAVADNDVLAYCFARLLLWTLPDRLPARDQPEIGWRQYLDAWRPGRSRPEAWPASVAQAWSVVAP